MHLVWSCVNSLCMRVSVLIPAFPWSQLMFSCIFQMQPILIVFVAATCLFGLAKAQAPEPLKVLNVTQYLGRWLQVRRAFSIDVFARDLDPWFLQAYSDLAVMGSFEAGGVCVNANYGLFPNGSVSVFNSERQRTM